jgi:hypothetical protein
MKEAIMDNIIVIKDTAALTKRVKALGSKVANFRKEVQTLGVSALAHIADHGDYTLLARIAVTLTGKSRSSFESWCQACCPALVRNADVGFKKKKGEALVVDMTLAMESEWDTYTKPRSEAVITANGIITNALKRIGKMENLSSSDLLSIKVQVENFLKTHGLESEAA